MVGSRSGSKLRAFHHYAAEVSSHGWLVSPVPSLSKVSDTYFLPDSIFDLSGGEMKPLNQTETVMEAYKYRHLVWEFNALLDTGKFDDLTLDDVNQHMAAGTVSSFLVDRFGREIDLSFMEPGDWTDLTDDWQRLHNALDPGRKMGVWNKGLCLLLGYALELYQQKTRQTDG